MHCPTLITGREALNGTVIVARVSASGCRPRRAPARRWDEPTHAAPPHWHGIGGGMVALSLASVNRSGVCARRAWLPTLVVPLTKGKGIP
eukprot:gene12481-12569_t